MEDYQNKLSEIESQSSELLKALAALNDRAELYANAEGKLESASNELVELIDSTKSSVIETQNLIRVSKEISAAGLQNNLVAISTKLEEIEKNIELNGESINEVSVGLATESGLELTAEKYLKKIISHQELQSKKTKFYLNVIICILIILFISQFISFGNS